MKLFLRHLHSLLLTASAATLVFFVTGCGSGRVEAAQAAPIATALTASSVTAGSSAFTLTIIGSNFVDGAVVKFNGSARVTTFVSATQVTAAILASDIATAGTLSVTVTNPAPGGASNALAFTVFAPSGPPPVVTALSPATAIAGSGAFTLTVTGSSFGNGATVNFNGSVRSTTFVSATQLTAAILATDIATAGAPSVTVTNPGPGGVTSNALTFTVTAAVIPVAAFTGTVKAGVQPVSGASVQIYAAGTTGNGSPPRALLTSVLTTDAAGNFSVPVGFVCPLGSSQLYVLSRGGSVGVASANPAIAFITSLGACDQVVASSHIVLNEVTTVATAWALSQFLSATGNIGSSSTNTVGLANAFLTAGNLANSATGASPGAAFPSNGSTPAPKINSLANLLNTCTSAATSTAAACTNLLGSSTDTLAAALRIVRNPAVNVVSLYTQSLTSTAFSPVLSKAPSDWTLFINYTGSGLYEPTSLGVDSKGNVWVASYFSANSTDPSVGLVAEFTPLGKPVFPNGITGSGLNNIYGLAIDASNNIWVANQQSPGGVNGGFGSITVLNSSGQPLSGANGYSAGGLNYPTAISIDPDTSVWIVDYGNSHITRLSKAGVPLSGPTGYTASSIAFAVAIAVDASHNAWIGNQNDGFVTRISSDGTTTKPFACCDKPNSLAIDQSGNLWTANFGGSVSMISSAGTIVSNNAYLGNGNFSGPQGIAIDGAGNVWVGNFHAGYLTELAGASASTPGQPLSPTPGWAPDANLFGTFAIAIDASGNIWSTNLYSNSVEEFVGLAAPVKTPLIGPPQAP